MKLGRQKSAACVHCRQMKLRCDGHLRFPGSCSRCEKAGVPCSIDPTFKRTPRRERLDILERELREIKQKLDTDSSPLVSSSSNPGVNGPSHPSALSPRRDLGDVRRNLTSRLLGDVELEPEMIGDLVEEYYTHYHNTLPILPEVADFISHSDQCPLLFWTVMAVGLRNKTEHRDVYFRLRQPVLDMAYDVVRPGNRPLQSIQALLMLCCWPLPFGASKDDPSSAFVALATVEALRLGLHRPKLPSDFEYEASYDEQATIMRRKTWIACFIINQSVAGQMGVPALTRLDQSLLEAMARKPAWLPDSLYFQLHIARHDHNIALVLGHYEMSSTGLLPNPAPTIRMFEAELNMQEAQFAEYWTKQNFISFLGCRLLLYNFALAVIAPTGATDTQQREFDNHWLPQAYLTATKLLQITSSTRSDIPFAPSHVRRCIIDAICFLLRLTQYAHHHFVDDVIVRNCVNQGWDILKGCSFMENDSMSRACAVIEYLSTEQKGQGVPELDASLSIKSRMGANLSVDSVFRARNRFSQFVKDQRPRDYTEAAATESLITNMGTGFAENMWPSNEFNSVGISWDTVFQDIWST